MVNSSGVLNVTCDVMIMSSKKVKGVVFKWFVKYSCVTLSPRRFLIGYIIYNVGQSVKFYNSRGFLKR